MRVLRISYDCLPASLRETPIVRDAHRHVVHEGKAWQVIHNRRVVAHVDDPKVGALLLPRIRLEKKCAARHVRTKEVGETHPQNMRPISNVPLPS